MKLAPRRKVKYSTDKFIHSEGNVDYILVESVNKTSYKNQE